MAEPNVIPRLNTLDYDPSWSELFGSAFRNENVIGSAVQRLGNSRIFGDSDPTPVTDDDINQAVNESGLTPFIEHFTSVQTRGDLNNKIAALTKVVETLPRAESVDLKPLEESFHKSITDLEQKLWTVASRKVEEPVKPTNWLGWAAVGISIISVLLRFV